MVRQQYLIRMIQLNRRPSFWSRFLLMGCFLSLFETTKSSYQKEKYNYAIGVRPVDRCPMNESEWQAAATRTGCNSTRGYHCVPDKFHSTLIEFCYNKSRILVLEGNCLDLAASGVLNSVKCHEFTKGCPDNHYFSNEIYKYPFCLSLAFRCFTSDIKCLDQKFKEQQREGKHPDCEAKSPIETILALCLFLFLLTFCLCVSVYLLCIYRKKIRKLQRHLTSLEQEITVDKRPQDGISDDLQVAGKIENELVIDDIYLSLLLKRHCRNGVFKNFIYLLERRIMKKKNDKYDVNLLKILTSRDKDGRSLLHFAAEGGSVKILEALIKAKDEINDEIEDKIKIDNTTYDGRTVLHIACKNKHFSLCRHLLNNNNYKDLLLDKKTVHGWNAAHFAALGGDKFIMDILRSKNLDIKIETKTGLNILDIACLHNNTEMCKDLMGLEDLNLPLDKSDVRGWSIAHFAAMTGNTEIFDELIAKDIKILKTKSLKTILHVCCEYGHEELCKTILKSFGTIVHDKDNEGWNALHYAAKGGNLKVFKKIETFFKERQCETTLDERTVLHIACINNRIDICQYICNQEAYKKIINSKGEFRNWTAAHYVAVEERQDGTEKNLISILESSGIDLQAITVDGLTVLGVACEHRNRTLVDFLLEKHNYLLGVGKNYLEIAAKESNDDYITATIKVALKNYHGKTVDAQVSGVTERKCDNVRLAKMQGSDENLALLRI